MNSMEHFFDTREQASDAAAARISEALVHRLDMQKTTALVVSGGSSPVQCFDTLSRQAIDWDRIIVLASDDRWVAPDHDDSNEKLIRDKLLVGKAAGGTLLPFYAPDTSVDERVTQLNEDIRYAPLPFACAMLGMGADGHFASLFPDADNLDAGLDLESDDLYLPVRTAASPHARISLSLAALSRSDEIVLLFFGEDKLAVYERAKAGDRQLPVARLLRQKRAPVHIYWAP
jgi:6-phosphogluconolactonase